MAAAVRSGSEVIVTYNKRHFSESALKCFGITCKGPSSFLRDLYDIDPSIATRKIVGQAENLGISLEELLSKMNKAVPSFVEFFCEELQIETCP